MPFTTVMFEKQEEVRTKYDVYCCAKIDILHMLNHLQSLRMKYLIEKIFVYDYMLSNARSVTRLLNP